MFNRHSENADAMQLLRDSVETGTVHGNLTQFESDRRSIHFSQRKYAKRTTEMSDNDHQCAGGCYKC